MGLFSEMMDEGGERTAEIAELRCEVEALRAEKDFNAGQGRPLEAENQRLRLELIAAKPLYSRRQLEAEKDRLRAALDRVMVAGNHIATYRTDRWPDYKPDGLTREQHCEHALRTLGAGREYDMWCCWSAIMQTRDDVQ